MTIISNALVNLFLKLRTMVYLLIWLVALLCLITIAVPILCVASAFVIVLMTFIIKLSIKLFISRIFKGGVSCG